MPIWRIDFFPEEDKRNSPLEYISGLSRAADRAAIQLRLETMQKRERVDWASSWKKKIANGVYQCTIGKHRLYYCLYGRVIVVLHACRKQKGHMLPKDKDRVIINYNRYLESKEG